MNSVGKNEGLIDYMASKKLYLLSGVLNRVVIFEEQGMPCIELYFTLIAKKDRLKIRFNNISEYSFYYRDDCYFYNIERCKFFKNRDTFYLSLDPYDDKEEINDNDQDFILCREIEGFLA
jgi:hypothetical protein